MHLDWLPHGKDSARVAGFCIDEGADIFCSSYDVTFRLCEDVGVSVPTRDESRLVPERSVVRDPRRSYGPPAQSQGVASDMRGYGSKDYDTAAAEGERART